jgi:hypothetical protein
MSGKETILPASIPNGGRETWEALGFLDVKRFAGKDEKLQNCNSWSLAQSAQAKTCKTATVPLPNRRICCKVANLKPNACHPLTVPLFRPVEDSFTFAARLSLLG